MLLSDALATPYTLARQRAKSHMLVYAHRRLLASEAFVELADRAEIAHLSGDCNPLSDSASRFKIDELQQLCSQLSIKPERVSIPSEAQLIFDDVLAYAVAIDNRVNPTRSRPPPPLPAAVDALLVPARRNIEALSEAADGESRSGSTGQPRSVRLRGSGPDGTSDSNDDESRSSSSGLPSQRATMQQAELALGAIVAQSRLASTSQVPPPGFVRRTLPAPAPRKQALPIVGGTAMHASAEQPSSAAGAMRAPPRVERSMNANPAPDSASTTMPYDSASFNPLLGFQHGEAGSMMHRGERATGASSNQPLEGAGHSGVSASKPPMPPPRRGLETPRSEQGEASPLRPNHQRLLAAGMEQANRRSSEWSDSPFFRNCHTEQLDGLIANAQAAADLGAASSTLRKDETTWKLWCRFALELKFDPHLAPKDVQERPAEVHTLLATFLLWVYPKMRGKNRRRWAKPSSAFQYVLALLRIFKRWDIPLPSAKLVKQKVKGLMRAFTKIYGPLALAPNRKEPMRYDMVKRILELADDTRLHEGQTWTRACPLCRCARKLLAVMWRSGHRLGDLIGEHASTRADLSYVIDEVIYVDPPPDVLRRMKRGDMVRLAPGTTKTDQFGQRWAPFGTVLPFEDQPNNAAYMFQQEELASPCHGEARKRTLLFHVENKPPTHAVLDDVLRRLLTTLYGAACASKYSWHSLRSGLAPILRERDSCHDAGVTEVTHTHTIPTLPALTLPLVL